MPFRDLPFFPDGGSDERQYCSPGFNLPVGSLVRAMYGTYPEYHTSLDNKELISFDAVSETIDTYEQIARVLEQNCTYHSLQPYGEPQLGRRGLYPTLGGRDADEALSALMWLLNYADGEHDLLTVASLSGLSLDALAGAAAKVSAAGLVRPASPQRRRTFSET